MLPDDQEGRLRCYKNALRNWKYRGYIRFKPVAQEWLAKELPLYTLREIARLLNEYVEAEGVIEEQAERRPEYVSFEFHYDLRVNFGGRRIYFETILLCED